MVFFFCFLAGGIITDFDRYQPDVIGSEVVYVMAAGDSDYEGGETTMRMVSKNNDQVEIGDNIRLLRESKDMSQDQLADILGTNRKAVSRYETGAQEMGVNTFVQYVDALEADPSQLLPQRLFNRKGSSLMAQLETAADGLSEGDMVHLIQYAKRLKTGSW